MGWTTKVLLLIFSALIAPGHAVCPHEDGPFGNWSDPTTWDDGKVTYRSSALELAVKFHDQTYNSMSHLQLKIILLYN